MLRLRVEPLGDLGNALEEGKKGYEASWELSRRGRGLRRCERNITRNAD
jgi:hypothetical protein